MAYTVPNGSKIFISKTLAAAIAVTAVTNATTAVASAAGTQTVGKEFIFTSGWEDANNAVYRVANPTAGAFEIEGLDTTNTALYTPGGGIGSIRIIDAWQEIQQVLNPSSSGGEAKFADVSPLAKMRDFQIPTGFTAQSLTIPIGDDPSLPGYIELKKASKERRLVALKVLKPNGNVNYFYGYVALNEMPSLTKDQVDTVTASFAAQGDAVRYAV